MRSRYVVKQFKDAKDRCFFARTPRATIHAHHGDGSNVTSRHPHDDGLQSFIHAYPVKDGHGIKVEIPPEDGTGCGMVWNLKRSLCGLGEADLRFHQFCVVSWWNLVFEVWNAEPTIFFHRLKKTSELWVRTDDPLASGSSEEPLTEFLDGVAKRLAIKTLCLVPCCSDLDEIVERSKLVHMHSFRDAAGMAQCKPVGTL